MLFEFPHLRAKQRGSVVTIRVFGETELERISRELVHGVSHRELTILFRECDIVERGGIPRWERIKLALQFQQEQDRSGGIKVVAFIEAVMNPMRFTDKEEGLHEKMLKSLNKLLLFFGQMVREDGKMIAKQPVKTLQESERRSSQLRKALSGQNVHADVLRFCRPELLQKNYFHAVFEATKSVADKIRSKSGLSSDGSKLVEDAFGYRPPNFPILAFNNLKTKTDQSEHLGIMNLIKGLFGAFRNALAHEPKIYWKIDEKDARDILVLASLIHRKLDAAVATRLNTSTRT